jgi:hypothetical protein
MTADALVLEQWLDLLLIGRGTGLTRPGRPFVTVAATGGPGADRGQQQQRVWPSGATVDACTRNGALLPS